MRRAQTARHIDRARSTLDIAKHFSTGSSAHLFSPDTRPVTDVIPAQPPTSTETVRRRGTRYPRTRVVDLDIRAIQICIG